MKSVRLILKKLIKSLIEMPGVTLATCVALRRGCLLGPGTRRRTGPNRAFQSVGLATDH